MNHEHKGTSMRTRYGTMLVGLAAAALLLAPRPAQAMYRDGPNLYQYVRSGPVNHVDPQGLWTRDTWADSSGTATAEPCDTLSHLAYAITGKASDWKLLGIPETIKVGQKVDVTPLLRKYDERLRASVVANTSKLNASFEYNGDIASSNEAGVLKFFAGGATNEKTECFWAYRLVFTKGLIDNLKSGEFDSLHYSPGSIPISERTGKIGTMTLGDRGYIKNYADYLAKHPGGGYQGENIIMVGNDRYWGFPADSKSYADWESTLRNAYNTGLPAAQQRSDALPGFLQNEIEFLNVPQIGMDVFDLRENKRKGRTP